MGAPSLDQKPDGFYKALVKSRAERLLARADEKYGPTASSTKGDESRDIFDYTINELAGIPRYVDMMIARLEDMPLHPAHIKRMKALLRWTAEDAVHRAWLLERMRQELFHHHIKLGEPEEI